jgi:hypothetical protein
MINEPLSDEEADRANAAQLARAIADTKALWSVLDGKDPLEAWGALPDTRTE